MAATVTNSELSGEPSTILEHTLVSHILAIRAEKSLFCQETAKVDLTERVRN